MKFDDLDFKMRVFESKNDEYILPEIFIIARVDGRSFTRLTKEVHKFESPFDSVFRDYMVETAKHLMNCGFRIIYAYTESDEISLLFHKNENAFGRKYRKINSILSGEASAKFSIQLGDIGCFDSRISQLPNKDLVIDYFRWRNEDAYRNALNAHCYWMLRKKGNDASYATNYLSKMSVSDKNELLFQNGINFNELPNWQKRGIGLYFEETEKKSINPIENKEVLSKRRLIKVNYDLPMKDDYELFIKNILDSENC